MLFKEVKDRIRLDIKKLGFRFNEAGNQPRTGNTIYFGRSRVIHFM
jgi:hypothetical protein